MRIVYIGILVKKQSEGILAFLRSDRVIFKSSGVFYAFDDGELTAAGLAPRKSVRDNHSTI